MRIIFSLVVILTLALSFGSSCKSSSPPTYCDTACMKDTLKYVNETHPLKPYVYVKVKDCNPDTIVWSYNGAVANRKMKFAEVFNDDHKVNKDYIRCILGDTTAAWLVFRDCITGEGYQVKMYFDPKKGMVPKRGSFINFDKKFAIPDDMAVWSDKGNLFVEDMKTGKKAMMTFGQKLELDYQNIHTLIDSINVTPTSIYAKVFMDKEWRVKEKKITLE